jgi:hypothetical protein
MSVQSYFGFTPFWHDMHVIILCCRTRYLRLPTDILIHHSGIKLSICLRLIRQRWKQWTATCLPFKGQHARSLISVPSSIPYSVTKEIT